jgi:uncharacterized caspase-like protein
MIGTACLLSLLGLALMAQDSLAAGGVRRFALVAGANFGGDDRPLLKYAVSDAQSFAQVLTSMGGVDPADRVVLRQPSLRELEAALDELRTQVASAAAVGGDEFGRTEILFYYSGHADDRGLLLGADRYSYATLRERLGGIPADVRIAVLDACASGAITRLKGGRKRKAFLVDASSDMRGHAFLTSSSMDEVAQESDRIGGSFFTHYLVSGLRGAADVSGDGKVTLNEAYQFAFHETLGRTTETQGGAQHPAYDINLSGTGDVVMTDVRQTSAGLVLNEELGGRFFVRNAGRQLVVELHKLPGRRVELGLEPGDYRVRCEQEEGAWISSTALEEGKRVVLGPQDFEPTSREQTVLRGGLGSGFGTRDRRARLELRFGYWDAGGLGESPSGMRAVTTAASAENISFSLGFARPVRENLVFTLAASALTGQADMGMDASGVNTKASGVASILAGVRMYLPGSSGLRPHLKIAVGPYIGVGSEELTVWGSEGVRTEAFTVGTFGGNVAGGLEMKLSRSWVLGVSAGYNFMRDFSRPVGGRRNLSGYEMGVGISWLLGRGDVRE